MTTANFTTLLDQPARPPPVLDARPLPLAAHRRSPSSPPHCSHTAPAPPAPDTRARLRHAPRDARHHRASISLAPQCHAPSIRQSSIIARRAILAPTPTLPRPAPPVLPALPHSPTPPTPVLPYLVPLYFAGILALSLLHLGGWLQLQLLRRTARADR